MSSVAPEAFPPWIQSRNAALLTDFYELTMLQAYWREGLDQEATFSLFARRLPAHRNYLLACGLGEGLSYLENLCFDEPSLDFLAARPEFSIPFVEWLTDFRFTGDVYAVAEGTPLFANEPLVEVVAPLPQGQLVESFLMNQLHHQTVVASKACRVVTAAAGRTVVDFGLRRMHGTDAAVKAARAFFIAGVDSTSNVFAGAAYAIPVAGTMAHSYVQAHADELEAFRAFVELYPDTVLLVDTYDTLDGVRKVVELARELGEKFRVRGVRLDSGDLARLAQEVRRILDQAGLTGVEIFASSSLDEDEIARLLDQGAPITGFGVGTRMGVSEDAPSLDMAYKLTSYAGEGRLKLAPSKPVLPGRKQVFRHEAHGRAVEDVLARHDEALAGRPLIHKVMEGGERLASGLASLGEARARAQDEIARLPDRIRALEPADPAYPVRVSQGLAAEEEKVRRRLGT